MGLAENISADLNGAIGRMASGVRNVGQEMAERIRLRTREGRDRFGNAFAPSGSKDAASPYSKRHARRRRKAGRQISRIDLHFTGQMLADFGVVGGSGGAYDPASTLFNPAGRGAKYQAPITRQFQSVSDVEVKLGVRGGAGARSSRAKAWAHQTGQGDHWKQTPPREWMGLAPEDVDYLYQEFDTMFNATLVEGTGATDLVISVM